MPATARHGAARATHTTSRTTANVSYHLWQHCCWQDTIEGALFFPFCTFVKFFPRGLPRHSHRVSLFGSMFPWVYVATAAAAAAAAVHVANVSCLKCFAPNCISLLIRVALCLLSALVSGGFSPSSTATSGFSSQGSNTLPCPIPPMAPTSPRSSTGKRRNRKKDHKSSCMTGLLCFVFLVFFLEEGWRL